MGENMEDMDMKKEVLRRLMKEMRNEMGEPVKGKLKKVSVVSDSDKGLSEGLNKAEQILKKFQSMKGDSNPYHSLDKGGPEISEEGEQSGPMNDEELFEDLGEQEDSLKDTLDEEEMRKLLMKKR